MTAALFVFLILVGLAVGFLIWGRTYSAINEVEFEMARLQKQLNQIQSDNSQLRQHLRITD